MLPDRLGGRRPRQAGFLQFPRERRIQQRPSRPDSISLGIGTSLWLGAAADRLVQRGQGTQPEQLVRLDGEHHGRHSSDPPG